MERRGRSKAPFTFSFERRMVCKPSAHLQTIPFSLRIPARVPFQNREGYSGCDDQKDGGG